MYYVYQLCILVLKEWPKVKSVLWGPVVQSPLVARGICSVGCMCPPFVVELQLLQTCWWLGLVPRPTGFKDQLQVLHACWFAGPAYWSISHLGGALVLDLVTHWVEWGWSIFGEPRQGRQFGYGRSSWKHLGGVHGVTDGNGTHQCWAG